MAYKGLIGSQLNMAFNMAKDLAVLVTFQKAAKEFDFSTGTVDTGVITSIPVKVIPLKTKKTKDSESLQILLKNKDVGDLSLFSTVVNNGVEWTIGTIIISNTYTSVLELTRTL
jgi:hypothetical protein